MLGDWFCVACFCLFVSGAWFLLFGSCRLLLLVCFGRLVFSIRFLAFVFCLWCLISSVRFLVLCLCVWAFGFGCSVFCF